MVASKLVKLSEPVLKQTYFSWKLTLSSASFPGPFAVFFIIF